MLLTLDFASEIPIYLQIRNQIVLGIARGSLNPGDQLPTIRALANESGINMMTVNKAYQLLKQEGYIHADRRQGAMISGELSSHNGLSEKAVASITLLICEAKLGGMSKTQLLALCGSLYDELEEA